MNLYGILIAVWMVPSLAEAKVELPVAECASDLKPLKTMIPQIGNSHGVFEGEARVEAVVLPTGNVESARIISSEWRPVGRHGSTKWADKAVLEAVMNWKYPLVAERCLKVVPFELRVE